MSKPKTAIVFKCGSCGGIVVTDFMDDGPATPQRTMAAANAQAIRVMDACNKSAPLIHNMASRQKRTPAP